MNRKIYVIGGSTGYANWMNGEITRNMEEADLVVLTGGADIHPKYYNEEVGKYTGYSNQRDELEYEEIQKALALDKKIIGICRGAQWLTIINGGKLIQHTTHSGGHRMKLFNGEEVYVNSLHHQMCYPFNITTPYKIIGYTEDLSSCYLNGNNQPTELPDNFVEPEIILFGNNHLGIQYHPEMMYRGYDLESSSEGSKKTTEIFENFMAGKLQKQVYE